MQLKGGGTVKYDDLQRVYLFVTGPEWGNFIEGNRMPDDWGIAGPIKEN